MNVGLFVFTKEAFQYHQYSEDEDLSGKKAHRETSKLSLIIVLETPDDRPNTDQGRSTKDVQEVLHQRD